MLRTYKYIYADFVGATAKSMQFSGYPGCIGQFFRCARSRGRTRSDAFSRCRAALIRCLTAYCVWPYVFFCVPLASGDDYYQTSAGLIVIETTNNVANTSLYQYVTPQSVPTFIRCVVATRMADSGAQWNEIYSQHNSGTYNSQFVHAWLCRSAREHAASAPLHFRFACFSLTRCRFTLFSLCALQING